MLSADAPVSRRLADTLESLYQRVVNPPSDERRLHRVGVVVIDGLGSDLLLDHAGHARFLGSTLTTRGTVVHSGLPSTTASALASITTGQPAGTHGLLGYQLRDPETAQLVNHLKPFPPGVQPEKWQSVPTVFERAMTHSIASIAVGESRFSGTDFSQAILRGARFSASSKLDEHLQLVREFFDDHDEAIAYLYWPALDRIGHQMGVAHSNWVDGLETVDAFAKTLSSLLRPGEAMVVTADHGMVDVREGDHLVVASDDPLRAEVQMWAGEPRLVQLYLHEGVSTDSFAKQLQLRLGVAATVLTRSQAIERELFDSLRANHHARLGDVMVFAEGSSAIYDELTASDQSRKMVGQHGSWRTRETSVPVIPLGSEWP